MPIFPIIQPDLPENWQPNNSLTTDGVSSGLSAKHGYNYLMNKVNSLAQRANQIVDIISSNTYDNETKMAYFRVVNGQPQLVVKDI